MPESTSAAVLQLVGLPEVEPQASGPQPARLSIEITSEDAPRLARHRPWLVRRGVEIVFEARGPLFRAANIAAGLGLPVRLLPTSATPDESRELWRVMELYLRSPHVRVPIEPFHTVTMDLVHAPQRQGPTLFERYGLAAAPRADARCAGCPTESACAGFLAAYSGVCPDVWRGMFEHLARAAAEVRAGLSDGTRPPVTTPPEANALVSFACNNDCIFCAPGHKRAPTSPRESLERVRSFVQRAASAGARSLALSGAGEPTLLPELPELVALAREVGFQSVTVFTNGSHPELIAPLVAAGATAFLLSLHGPEDVHDAVVRRAGAFSAARATLAVIRGLGIPVTVNTVLTRPLLGGLHAFAASLARERTRHFLCYPEWAGHVFQNLALIPTYDEVVATLADGAWADGPAGVAFDNVPLCLLSGAPPREAPAKDALHLDLDSEKTFTTELNCGHNLLPGFCGALGCPRRAICPGLDRQYVAHHGPSALRAIEALARPVVAAWRRGDRASRADA